MIRDIKSYLVPARKFCNVDVKLFPSLVFLFVSVSVSIVVLSRENFVELKVSFSLYFVCTVSRTAVVEDSFCSASSKFHVRVICELLFSPALTKLGSPGGDACLKEIPSIINARLSTVG